MIKKTPREGFSGKFGVIAAAAGSAVGLGNLWRFPYVLGENGGGAFLLIYVLFVVGIGIPVILSEFVIGRASGTNAMHALKNLSPKSNWWILGLMGIITAFIILSFYSTVSGWTLDYVIQSIQNNFVGKSPKDLNEDFTNFITDSYRPVIWQLIFLLLTALVVLGGVKKGIEKFTKILMPLLVVLILLVCIRGVTLPGSVEGLKFLFAPDFSKLTYKVVLMALGQAAFSLSIGMGALITYGAYINNKTSLTSVAINVALADSIIAILCGVMIFPALFSMGATPDSGPSLIFITLPRIFQSMSGGYIISIIFFMLVSIAALTSTISLLEVVVALVIEKFKTSRLVATVSSTIAVAFVGVFCTLSFGPLRDFTIFNKTLFDLLDFISANILLTFGALFIVIYTGWVLGKTRFVNEINKSGKINPIVTDVIVFIIRYIAPIAIGAIAVSVFFINDLL